MLRTSLRELHLVEAWYQDDSRTRFEFAFPFFDMTGTEQSSVIYFVIPPGKVQGLHQDTAEEVILVLEGEAEVVVGEERAQAGQGDMWVVPRGVPHQVCNPGTIPVRCVGFLSSARPRARFSQPLMPLQEQDAEMPIFEDAPITWNEITRRLGGSQ
jgi:quercetin dioxygenase-like cupin family protein